MKRKISITLDPYAAAWLETAVQLLLETKAGQLPGGRGIRMELRTAKRFLLCKAIGAVSREVVLDGRIPIPLAVTLRHETEHETQSRIAGVPPREDTRENWPEPPG